jgi:hypothetical protein
MKPTPSWSYFYSAITCLQFSSIYRVVQKSVNLKDFPVLTGMFTFKSNSQYADRYHSVVSCACNMEDLIKKMFANLSNKVFPNVRDQ